MLAWSVLRCSPQIDLEGMKKVMEDLSFMVTHVQARNYIHDLAHKTEFVFNTL